MIANLGHHFEARMNKEIIDLPLPLYRRAEVVH